MGIIEYDCGCNVSYHIDTDGRLQRDMYAVDIELCDSHLSKAIIAENPRLDKTLSKEDEKPRNWRYVCRVCKDDVPSLKGQPKSMLIFCGKCSKWRVFDRWVNEEIKSD